MHQLSEHRDESIEMRLRIQRTAEPGVIIAIAWEGGYMTPGQGWATRFMPWAALRGHLAEMIHVPARMLERAEKSFTSGRNFDIPITTRASQLQQMGFERQTA